MEKEEEEKGVKLMLLMGMMMMIQQSSSSHFAPYIEGTAARALSVCFLVSLVCINSSSNGCYYFVFHAEAIKAAELQNCHCNFNHNNSCC
ncbi:hypothetical protein TYRP_008665 [Tyrophagus putrescentiae]|nr:hypothetical protein TYRP_008665 [Tyrophagus putrescentiae]